MHVLLWLQNVVLVSGSMHKFMSPIYPYAEQFFYPSSLSFGECETVALDNTPVVRQSGVTYIVISVTVQRSRCCQ